MSTDHVSPAMGNTSIPVSEELAEELSNRKEQSKSYEDYLWKLLGKVDKMDSKERTNSHDTVVTEFGIETDDLPKTAVLQNNGVNHSLSNLETVTRNEEWGDETFRDAGKVTFGSRSF